MDEKEKDMHGDLDGYERKIRKDNSDIEDADDIIEDQIMETQYFDGMINDGEYDLKIKIFDLEDHTEQSINDWHKEVNKSGDIISRSIQDTIVANGMLIYHYYEG